MKRRLIIVDISSFIFRAFFAIRPMHAPDGRPTNAVYGVLTMLMKLLQTHTPSHVVLALDCKGKSFRNDTYEAYKANRGEAPEELVPQFEMIAKLIDVLKIPQKGVDRYEADDVIGSLVVQHQDAFDEVYIASGDKDLMQFVNGKVKMLDTMKAVLYGAKEVHEKMGVHPHQIMDYLSLVGDTSDNIPGVKGIGAKGAAKLLEEYGDLDTILSKVDEIKPKRAQSALQDHIEDAKISRKLVEIVTDLDLDFHPEDFKYELKANDELLAYLDELNFKTIRNKLQLGSSDVDFSRPESQINYKAVKTQKEFEKTVEALKEEDQVFLEPFFYHENYHLTDAKFLSVATGEKAYILYCEEISSYSEVLRPILELKEVLFVAADMKAPICSALKEGIVFQNYFDLQQAHFVLDPDKKHDLVSIAKETLDENLVGLKELRKESLEQEASVKNLEIGLARRASVGLRCYPWLIKKLQAKELYDVYEKLDAPLIPILSEMELKGITLDCDFYAELEKEFEEQTQRIEKEIAEIAGEEINLKSPKQVSTLLFEKMQLPIIKKTKTGASTDSSVLEQLVSMGHDDVAGKILRYREVDKLLSTYVRALPKLVEKDSRLHTHFTQHVASTGRLSSERPNLQNIPIKTENGRRLRKGFVASEGYFLLGADYSQVELRILAHLSQDEVMLKAFANDEDIHSQTAIEVFDLDPNNVPSEKRSFAKAINFGLMYGQSSFGLSQTLGISRADAKEYITKYFKKFHKVKSFLDQLKEECEAVGYSRTMLGRKRYIADINSTNRAMKSMAERMAINSPIQGTAADIIKQAMLDVHAELIKEKLESKLLLQVHDELIFEVPKDEVEVMKKIVRDKMESAAKLDVRLKVDMGVAVNWHDLK